MVSVVHTNNTENSSPVTPYPHREGAKEMIVKSLNPAKPSLGKLSLESSLGEPLGRSLRKPPGRSLGKPIVGRRLRRSPAALAVVMLGCVFLASASPVLDTPAMAATTTAKTSAVATTAEGDSSLEAAATKAGEMGRRVAMSLIGLALAVAGIVLAFRRDFKKVAGVLVIGLLAVLLATPTGVSVLQNTVTSLFGSA